MTTEHLPRPADLPVRIPRQSPDHDPMPPQRRGRGAVGDRLAATASAVMLVAGAMSALTTHAAPARATAYAVLGLMAARLAWLMRPAMARRPGAPYLVLPGVLTVLLLLACGVAEHGVWIAAALVLAPLVAVHAGVRSPGGAGPGRHGWRLGSSVGPAEHPRGQRRGERTPHDEHHEGDQ